MKDPFQVEASPYEILGIARDASASDIKSAFARAFVKSPNKAKRARDRLLRPGERAMIDLFLYMPGAVPDPSVLAEDRRSATLADWEKRFKSEASNEMLLHSLALGWYWWARRSNESEHWKSAIAFWAALESCGDFWRGGFLALNPEELAELRKSAVSKIRDELFDRRKAGADTEASSLELCFSAELNAARLLAGLDMDRERPLAAGPVLLGRLGLLDPLRAKLSGMLQRHPERADYRDALAALSPYADIAVLIEQCRTKEALAALDALQADDGEVNELYVKALVRHGKTQASLSRFTEALQAWGRALKRDPTNSGLCSTIVTTCQREADDRRRRGDLDGAVALVEQAMTLLDDARLKQTYARLLVDRAVKRINDAQKEAAENDSGADSGIIAGIEEAVGQLEKARGLGAAEADEQLKGAYDVLRQAREGFFNLDKEIRGLVREANAAAGRSEWLKAVTLLKEARARAAPRIPHVITANLALCLSNAAMERVKSAFDKFHEGRIKRQALRSIIAAARRQLERARTLDPSNKSFPDAIGQLDDLVLQAGLDVDDAVHEIIAGADEAMKENDWDRAVEILVRACDEAGRKGVPVVVKKRLAAALANRAGVSFQRLNDGGVEDPRSLVLAARDDLVDARALDPENDVIKSSLEQAEKALETLPSGPVLALVKEADAAAGKSDWDTAVKCFRTAIRSGDAKMRDSMRKNLSTCLGNRAAGLLKDLKNQKSGDVVRAKLRSALTDLLEAAVLNPEEGDLRSSLMSVVDAYCRASTILPFANTAPVQHLVAVALDHISVGRHGKAAAVFKEAANAMQGVALNPLKKIQGLLAARKLIEIVRSFSCCFVPQDPLENFPACEGRKEMALLAEAGKAAAAGDWTEVSKNLRVLYVSLEAPKRGAIAVRLAAALFLQARSTVLDAVPFGGFEGNWPEEEKVNAPHVAGLAALLEARWLDPSIAEKTKALFRDWVLALLSDTRLHRVDEVITAESQGAWNRAVNTLEKFSLKISGPSRSVVDSMMLVFRNFRAVEKLDSVLEGRMAEQYKSAELISVKKDLSEAFTSSMLNQVDSPNLRGFVQRVEAWRGFFDQAVAALSIPDCPVSTFAHDALVNYVGCAAVLGACCVGAYYLYSIF